MDDRLDRVIDQVYAAIDGTGDWSAALGAISEVTGAGSGCMVSTPGGNTRGNVNCFHNIDPDWIEAYNNWYHHYDPTPALLIAEPGKVHIDHVTAPHPAKARSDARIFYNEVMRPQNFRHTLHVGLSASTRWAASIVLQRPERTGSFGQEMVDILRRLMPHLRRALQLHARLRNVDGLNTGMAAALDRGPTGVILLDAAGRVVHINLRAEEILRTNPELQARTTGLTARNASENRELQKCIGAAIHADGKSRDTALRLHGRSGWPSLHLQITPLRPGDTGNPLVPGGVKAAVWLGSHQPAGVSPGTLGALYGLTPAESELLARLTEGYTRSEIAELRSVTLETIRTQLKAVMAKLGVSRQAELVRLVLSGPGAITSDG